MKMFKFWPNVFKCVITTESLNCPTTLRCAHVQTRGAKLLYNKRNSHRAIPLPRQSEASKVNWPTNVLDNAYNSGLIRLKSSISESFLSEFAQLAKFGPPSVSAAQPLLKRFSIDARTLFWLSWVLQKANPVDRRLGTVAKLLQTTAAALEDEYASLILVESALRAKKPYHPEISEAVKTLTFLSQQGNAFAQERLAVLSEMRGDESAALSLSEEALQSHSVPSSEQSFVLDPNFSAWKTVARIRGSIRLPSSGQVDPVEYGAKTLDDPDAYFDLAMGLDHSDLHDRLAYLLKAAASGDARAALEVADQYLELATSGLHRERLSGDPDSVKKVTSEATISTFYLALASEWYELALKLPKHSLNTIKEAAGDGIVIASGLLNEIKRCATLAAEHSEMQWARRYDSNTIKA